MTLIVQAGGDVDRVLLAWRAAEDPHAAVHMAALRQSLRYKGDRVFLDHLYVKEYKAAAEKIAEFLLLPGITERFERAFFAVEDERLQQMISDALGFILPEGADQSE